MAGPTRKVRTEQANLSSTTLNQSQTHAKIQSDDCGKAEVVATEVTTTWHACGYSRITSKSHRNNSRSTRPSKTVPTRATIRLLVANLLDCPGPRAGIFLFSAGFLILHITPNPLVISLQETQGSRTQVRDTGITPHQQTHSAMQR